MSMFALSNVQSWRLCSGGTAQLFPLRLSAPQRPVAAVQRLHRHDDDAVERRDPAAARRPARLRSAPARAAGGEPRLPGRRLGLDELARQIAARAMLAGLARRPPVTRATGSRSSSMPAPPASCCEPTADRDAIVESAEGPAGRRLDRGRAGHPARLRRRAAEHDRRRHQPRHPRHRRRFQRRRHQQRGAGRHGRARARATASR